MNKRWMKNGRYKWWEVPWNPNSWLGFRSSSIPCSNPVLCCIISCDRAWILRDLSLTLIMEIPKLYLTHQFKPDATLLKENSKSSPDKLVINKMSQSKRCRREVATCNTTIFNAANLTCIRNERLAASRGSWRDRSAWCNAPIIKAIQTSYNYKQAPPKFD